MSRPQWFQRIGQLHNNLHLLFAQLFRESALHALPEA
jgi:hypothetical protein